VCQVSRASNPFDQNGTWPARLLLGLYLREKNDFYLVQILLDAIEGVTWFVRGSYLTQQMKIDGIRPAKFEALMYEENDRKDLAVQRYGTQYLLCSMVIDDIDVTQMPLLNMCADARYLEAYKLKYQLKNTLLLEPK
jgi:hypothetical protein